MFLLINKPSGPTSHDVIDELRRITGIKRIGHAGTLDPFASGLLIVGVGRESTRELGKFLKMDKTYKATLKLGATSDTYDRTGTVRRLTTNNLQPASPAGGLTTEKIKGVLGQFKGEIEQIPPMYSAKKVKGKKLYELARKGIEVERKKIKVRVYELQLTTYDPKSSLLYVGCRVSSGTYIRSLAHDIGQTLGTGAYLEELERTAIGGYTLEEAIKVTELNKDNWRSYLLPVSLRATGRSAAISGIASSSNNSSQ